ncbi:MAG: DUF3551 domain-containing protein [Rhodoplanes sp.]|jgi:hypothetical protein
MRPTALLGLGLAALTAAFALDSAPASAQGYRLYPWCAYYNTRGGTTNCYFSTFEQCRAAISGIGGMCTENSWYAAYGPYYSLGGAPTARRAGRIRSY